MKPDSKKLNGLTENGALTEKDTLQNNTSVSVWQDAHMKDEEVKEPANPTTFHFIQTHQGASHGGESNGRNKRTKKTYNTFNELMHAYSDNGLIFDILDEGRSGKGSDRRNMRDHRSGRGNLR